ncbi:MAG: DUF2103 domain-containing protein [Candidatus Berkelbacteria bacterium]|nr:DUF2103 domain-containing protein [Candidatus Berkelbacteria bacterium]MCR4306949.1 DUF2103 domain-containing protein [Candidatus Berkelbacteria bacterium]
MSSLNSKKISGAHTSRIEVAKSIIEAASKLGCVNKIVLGVIKQVKSPPVYKSIKVAEVPAGIRVRVRGPKSVQELFIYTSDRPVATATIAEVFNS